MQTQCAHSGGWEAKPWPEILQFQKRRKVCLGAIHLLLSLIPEFATKWKHKLRIICCYCWKLSPYSFCLTTQGEQNNPEIEHFPAVYLLKNIIKVYFVQIRKHQGYYNCFSQLMGVNWKCPRLCSAYDPLPSDHFEPVLLALFHWGPWKLQVPSWLGVFIQVVFLSLETFAFLTLTQLSAYMSLSQGNRPYPLPN